MTIQKISALYFSPTGGTEAIVRFITNEIAGQLGLKPSFIDFTKQKNRQAAYRFENNELVLVASPVYAGRLPNKLLPDYTARILGSGNTPAVPLCVFGNRNFDEALRELILLLENNGFHPVGAAAFADRHAFSDHIGSGRPDDMDYSQMKHFAFKIAQKIRISTAMPPLNIDRSEIGPYYTPLKADRTPARFLKAKPVVDQSRCTNCGKCVSVCPLDSIDADTLDTTGLCIKCQACVRLCPSHARQFADADFLSHVAMLEQNYTTRAENLLII